MINQRPNGTYSVDLLIPFGFQIKPRELNELLCWVDDNRINGCHMIQDPEIVFDTKGRHCQLFTVYAPTMELAVEAKLRFA